MHRAELEPPEKLSWRTGQNEVRGCRDADLGSSGSGASMQGLALRGGILLYPLTDSGPVLGPLSLSLPKAPLFLQKQGQERQNMKRRREGGLGGEEEGCPLH